MGGSVIGIKMGYGYPGTYARGGDTYIMSRPVVASGADVPFGAAVALNADGTFQKFGASDTLAKFAGIAVREVKQATDFYAAMGVYKAKEAMDVIERGNVAVTCVEGTPDPTKGVYVCTVSATNTLPGDLVSVAVPAGTSAGTTIQLTNCRWVGVDTDSNKVAELAIVSRNNG